MKKTDGFTLIEGLVGVAVVGSIALFAIPSYNIYLAKSQAAEAVTMINSERLKLTAAINKGSCTLGGVSESIKGRFGTLVINGNYTAVQGEACPIGCNLTYIFNSPDVNKRLANKAVKVDVLKNLKIKKDDLSTTLDTSFLPTNFADAIVETGSQCANLNGLVGSFTNGSVTGTETGADAPVPPTPPGGEGAGPGGVGTEGDPSSGSGSGEAEDDPNVEIIRAQAYMQRLNYSIIFPAPQPYQIGYSAGVFSISQHVDRRTSGLVLKSNMVLQHLVPDNAKKAHVAVFVDGTLLWETTLTKKVAYTKPHFRFMHTAEISYDCGSRSNCEKTINRNSGGEYNAVHVPFVNLIKSHVQEYRYQNKPVDNLGMPYRKPVDVVYKIYY